MRVPTRSKEATKKANDAGKKAKADAVQKRSLQRRNSVVDAAQRSTCKGLWNIMSIIGAYLIIDVAAFAGALVFYHLESKSVTAAAAYTAYC